MEDSETVDKIIDKNGKTMGIITRPNASPGYWLCGLLPIAFLVTTYKQKICEDEDTHYWMLTISSFGMLMQSVNFFICLAVDAGRYLKLFFALTPGMVTNLLMQYWTTYSYEVCLAVGFGSTLGYQYMYVRMLKGFSKSCSLGEACILVQGVVLFIVNAFFKIPFFLRSPPTDDFKQISAIMVGALSCLLVVSSILGTIKICRKPILFYPLMIALVTGVCVTPVTKDLPILVVLHYILSDLNRVYIVIFYLSMAVAAILAVHWQLGSSEKASTRVRKIFHFLVVLVYIPGLVFECTFLFLATGVALSVIAVLEIIRMLRVPPLANILESAFATLHDDKDVGNVALTPFCLLIGCSLPLWINPCPCSKFDDSAVGQNMLSILAGIMSVGCGDTAASIVGSKFGKHKWGYLNRSMEGSLAFVVSQFLVTALLYALNLVVLDGCQIITFSLAVVITAVVEAYTDQIDNLVLPLIYYIIVK